MREGIGRRRKRSAESLPAFKRQKTNETNEIDEEGVALTDTLKES